MANAFWMCSFVLAAVMAAVVPPVASALGRSDPGDLYVVLTLGDTALDAKLQSPTGLKEIGPTRAPLSRVIQADEDMHQYLVARGYWILPAKWLEEVCGITLNPSFESL